MAQYQAFDGPGDDKHHGPRADKSQRIGQQQVLGAEPALCPTGKTGHGHGREQHHGALGEIEHTGGLEDQHKPEGHQRIEHAGHEATEQGFEKECHRVPFSDWRPDRR